MGFRARSKPSLLELISETRAPEASRASAPCHFMAHSYRHKRGSQSCSKAWMTSVRLQRCTFLGSFGPLGP